MDLSGKTAIVTGGASGIGRATAETFAAKEATTIIFDIDRESGTTVTDDINEAGGDATFMEVDVTEQRDVRDAIERVSRNHSGVDVMFNNAGVLPIDEFEETSSGDLERALAVNVKGVWNGCQAVVPIMRRRGRGSIINTSSVMGFMGDSNLSAYGLTKGAVLNFTRALAVEVGPANVRVNSICPAGLKTSMTEDIYDSEKEAERINATPLRRFCEPSEVATAVAFLASDDSSYITGEHLVIDGGYTVAPR